MKKKTLTIAIALVLVVALAVGATYAYLTAQTKAVTNTFTAGKAVDDDNLLLYEHKAKQKDDGSYALTDEKAQSNAYTVMPGVNLPKDPTVEVTKAEGPYYLFVEVTKGEKVDGTTLAYTVSSSNWVKLDGITDREVYAYKTADGTDPAILSKELAATPVLATIGNTDNTITVADDNAKISELTEANSALTFKAYACQAAGFADATEAFTTCFGTANP